MLGAAVRPDSFPATQLPGHPPDPAYGYGYAPAYSYGYPAYYGSYSRPYYGAYAYAGSRAVRRVVIHRARWR
jgi:hypothetical protein